MSVYICRRCDYSADRLWEGLCPGCGGIYRAKKVGAESAEQKSRSTFAAAATVQKNYVATGLEWLDHVLGGGFVPGNVVLFGGFRGTGKSTLWAKALDVFSEKKSCAYVSSEQSAEGVIKIAHRVEARSDRVLVLGDQGDIGPVLESLKKENIFLTVFDSLQKFYSHLSGGTRGSASQGTEVSSAIKEDCRARKSCAVIINQMSRGGQLRGGSDVEHDVDTIMVLAYPQPTDEDAPGFEEDGIRLLLTEKNRDGQENQKSYFRMTVDGQMEHVAAKSRLVDTRPQRKTYRKYD